MERRPFLSARRTALLGGAVLISGVVGGCGQASNSDGISVPRLQRELAKVIHLERLSQGADLSIFAACGEASPGDDLNYACLINAAGGSRNIHWTVYVSCRPPGQGEGPRCTSDQGDALQ